MTASRMLPQLYAHVSRRACSGRIVVLANRRQLYSFAWTRLMAGNSFPEQLCMDFGGSVSASQAKDPTVSQSWKTPLDIVEDWGHKEALCTDRVATTELPGRLSRYRELDQRKSVASHELIQAGFWPVRDLIRIFCIKRTFQPSLVRRKRKWGFLVRMRNRNGRKIIKRRRAKGRRRLAM